MVKASLVGFRGRLSASAAQRHRSTIYSRSFPVVPAADDRHSCVPSPPSRSPLPMPSMLAVAGVVTLLLAAYLIVAMLAPEWFA